jgi:hypothetical protein
MKILKLLAVTATAFVTFLSCQKEISFESGGKSAGTLVKDAAGDCAPATVNGIYKKDTVLTDLNFVDVQVNVTTPGTFDIKSDTVNGYSFSKTGSVTFGTNTIRLYASGKLVAAGVTNTFTITYGTSTCSFDVTVAPQGAGPAVFTLGSVAGVCTQAVPGGTYTAGVALAPANTLTVQVNVTTPGTYLLGAASTNGFLFTSSGTFSATGLQTVTLTGTGTPIAAGISIVTVTNIASTCTYAITVLPAAAPAVFTLDGAPNGCTNFTLNGTYTAGVATAAANTVTLNVNVTTIGSYTLSTNTVNGIKFSKTGAFTATGAQPVTLTATGTPTAAGAFSFTPAAGASTCTFSVTVQPGAAPAVYTLSGAPNACTPATVNGAYAASTPLGATNTVIVQVNVSSVGSYTLSTNTVNGITFSKSGTFTATGLQNVTLQGTGTPVAAGTNTFTPQAGASSCTFDIMVTGASSDVLQCKINGVLNTFNDLADATYFVPGDLLISGGKLYASFPDELVLDIDKSSTGGTVTTGTYVNTLAGSISGGYILGADYTDANIAHWGPRSIVDPSPDPFTIIITSLTATRVVGTFSGTIRDNFGIGTNTKTITEGVFNLPIK